MLERLGATVEIRKTACHFREVFLVNVFRRLENLRIQFHHLYFQYPALIANLAPSLAFRWEEDVPPLCRSSRWLPRKGMMHVSIGHRAFSPRARCRQTGRRYPA